MGLDMYAFSVPKENAIDDFTFKREEDYIEIHYWRKHHDLHGWMERLYRKKGGTKEDFNVCPVRLTLQDLDTLEHAVMTGNLPSTTGFFFGNCPPDDASQADDVYFIAKARREIKNGKEVYYDSWW